MITVKDLMKDYRLKSTIRYNNRNKINNETVAEHSFYVSLYTLQICNKLNLHPIVTKLALEKAILHDMVEADISDIPHDVKKKIEGLKTILEKQEKELNEKLDYRFACDRTNNIETLRSYKVDYDDKTENIIDTIVKIADTYSVLQYCLKEEMLGNKDNEFRSIEERARKFIVEGEKSITEYFDGKDRIC